MQVAIMVALTALGQSMSFYAPEREDLAIRVQEFRVQGSVVPSPTAERADGGEEPLPEPQKFKAILINFRLRIDGLAGADGFSRLRCVFRTTGGGQDIWYHYNASVREFKIVRDPDFIEVTLIAPRFNEKYDNKITYQVDVGELNRPGTAGGSARINEFVVRNSFPWKNVSKDGVLSDLYGFKQLREEGKDVASLALPSYSAELSQGVVRGIWSLQTGPAPVQVTAIYAKGQTYAASQIPSGQIPSGQIPSGQTLGTEAITTALEPPAAGEEYTYGVPKEGDVVLKLIDAMIAPKDASTIPDETGQPRRGPVPPGPWSSPSPAPPDGSGAALAPVVAPTTAGYYGAAGVAPQGGSVAYTPALEASRAGRRSRLGGLVRSIFSGVR